jgi:hypothetical protein
VVSNFYENGADTQAVWVHDGAGPYLIDNNYLEAAGENFMVGGECTSAQIYQPQDITITRNYLYKPMTWCTTCGSWDGVSRVVKNSLELKMGIRVLIQGNVIANNWSGQGQNGFTFLITPRNQTSSCSYAQVKDVTYRYNIMHHATAGVNILGTDDTFPSQPTQRVLFNDNLFYDITRIDSAGSGHPGGCNYQINTGPSTSAPTDITMWHNTSINSASAIFWTGNNLQNGTMTFSNNLNSDQNGGYSADGLGCCATSMATKAPGTLFNKNILYGPFPAGNGEVPSQYSAYCTAGTCNSSASNNMIFPANQAAVMFVNPGSNNYTLTCPGSPYCSAGTDGANIGANISAVNAATAGVEVQP